MRRWNGETCPHCNQSKIYDAHSKYIPGEPAWYCPICGWMMPFPDERYLHCMGLDRRDHEISPA